MKKIVFYISEIEPEENVDLYHSSFKNSLISYDSQENKFIFKSKYNHKQEFIEYHYEKIAFDKNMVKTIKEILVLSYSEAKTISSENMGNEIIPGSIVSSLTSLVNKYSYFTDSEGKNIFDFVTDLFIRIMMGHYLNNGNKRLALVFLKGILWHFGYYLKWTGGMLKNYNTHKTIIEEFVKRLENNSNNNYELEFYTIKKWIMENVIIGLNWRR